MDAGPPARVLVSGDGERRVGEQRGGVPGNAEGREASGGTPGDAELLEVAVQAATMAGGLLMERVRAGGEKEVSSKSTPTDLVSEADLASEHAIKALLAERRPNDGFVGEEGGSEEGTSGLEWVVDPLDGTVNFLFGIPQWCVSVAVRDAAGMTVAGAVYDPNRGELFTATRDGEARLRGGVGDDDDRGALVAGTTGVVGRAEWGERDALGLRGSRRVELATAMVATGFAYDARVRAAQAKVLARAIPRVRDIRRLGSAALDLCWTAAGRFDGYFERTVKPWDIAAGALICERAGLRVVDLEEHEDLPYGILAAPEGLAGKLLELVGGPA
ncbi:MAG: inositol monophosphatase family protein [Solirubrobacteraceae bacterium]